MSEPGSEPPKKTALPSKNQGGGRRSGQMAASVLTQDAVAMGMEAQVNPEGQWIEGQVQDSAQGSLLIKLMAVLILVGIGFVVFQTVLSRGETSASISAAPQKEESKLLADYPPPLPINQLLEANSAEDIDVLLRKALTTYHATDSIEDRIELVYPYEGIKDQMVDYYTKNPDAIKARPYQPMHIGPVSLNGLVIYAASGTFTDTGETANFSLIPVKDRFLVEWASSVAYSEHSVTEIMEQKLETPSLVRCFIGPPIRQPNTGQPGIIRLEATPSGVGYTSYADPDGPVYRSIMNQEVGHTFPYLTRLHWNPSRRLLEVDELIHRYWIDTDFLLSQMEDRPTDSEGNDLDAAP